MAHSASVLYVPCHDNGRAPENQTNVDLTWYAAKGLTSFYILVGFCKSKTTNIGVVVYDADADILRLRFRTDLDSINELDETDGEVLAALVEDLTAKADELGPLPLIRWLEENCSNAIRVSERVQVNALSEAVLDWIFQTEVIEGSSSTPT